MRLNPREKLLLFILALVVILVGGIRFLVVPAYETYTKSKSTLASLQNEQLRTKNEISSSGKVNTAVQDALSSAKNAASALLPSVRNDVVNVWLVNQAAKFNLKVSSVSFSNCYPANIGQQSASKSPSDSYLLKTYAETYRGNTVKSSSSQTSGDKSGSSSASSSSASNSKSGPEGSVLALEVSCSMTGSYDEVKSFLDSIKVSGRTIAVTALNLSGTGGSLQVQATLVFYGAEKPDDSDSIFEWALPGPDGKKSLM